jgi:hypothetical protein
MQIFEDEACTKAIQFSAILAGGEKNYGKYFWVKTHHDQPGEARRFHNLCSALLGENDFEQQERKWGLPDLSEALAS